MSADPRQLLDALENRDDSAAVLEIRRFLQTDPDLEPFLPALIRSLEVPSADVRYLAGAALIQAVAGKGADIEPALPALKALFGDDRQASWLAKTAIGHVGNEAFRAFALHLVQQERWRDLETWIVEESPRAALAVSCLRGAARRRGLAGMETILARAQASDDPDLRGAAAAVLAWAYSPAGRWGDIEKLLDSPDYAIRWYVLLALDDLAEDKVDVSPLIPALLAVFAHDDATLEKDRNVRYKATLRGLAAGVLVWILIARNEFPRKRRPVFLNGVNVDEIPEVRHAMKQMRSLARGAESNR